MPHKVHYIDDTKPQIVAATGKSLLVEIAGCISGHVPGPRMGNVPPARLLWLKPWIEAAKTRRTTMCWRSRSLTS